MDDGTEQVSKRKALGSLAGFGADFARGALSSLAGVKARKEIARDAGARRREIAKMGVSVGKTMGAAKIGSIGKSTEQREEIRRRASERATNHVIEALGNMKGLAMKLGQLASYAATMSDEAEEQLAVLQFTSEPIPYGAVEQVVVEELGRPPDEIFASFDTEPVASASVGQVHRARTHDGREVAVKVQYPGVEEAILSDLANMHQLSMIAAISGGHIEFQGLYDEIGTLVREELDYKAEASNQMEFADRFRGHPHVRIPEVYPEYSSRRVLSSEFVEGRTLYEVLDLPQAERDALGEIIYRFNLGCLLSGTFSGDPHPGNYIFCDDGRVCFIDFGLVKRLDTTEQEKVRSLATAALTRDGAAVEIALSSMGLEAPDVDPQMLFAEFGPCAFGPVATDAAHAMSKEEYRENLRAMQNPEGELVKVQRSANPPPWIPVFIRYGFGTVAVVSRLGAEANWHRLMKELVG